MRGFAQACANETLLGAKGLNGRSWCDLVRLHDDSYRMRAIQHKLASSPILPRIYLPSLPSPQVAPRTSFKPHLVHTRLLSRALVGRQSAHLGLHSLA